MTADEAQQHHAGQSTLRDYLAVARRRKWIILQAFVIVPLAAVLFSLQQAAVYESSAEVLLSRQNLATSLTGTQDPTAYQQADRIAQTQAAVAEVPDVAERALEKTGLADSRTVDEFLAASSVSAKQNADILEFRVSDRDPGVARRLATAYAQTFTEYRRELDTAAISRARTEVAQRLATLERQGSEKSALYASLVDKEQQLATMEALQTSNAFVVREAGEAGQVQPRPVRNAILGIALGLVLGIGLAFLWEALDTRIRSSEELESRLGMPLLARLPEPPKRLRSANRLVMLANPTGVEAEAFRMLRTNLEFTALDREVKTIMVTSAVQQEGKSTTSANLAVALARAGQRVVLVDLDLRRPFLQEFFDLAGRPGITQVVLGHAELDDALASIAISSSERRYPADDAPRSNGSGRHLEEDGRGSLQVLGSGPAPPDPGEFVGTRSLRDVLQRLRSAADVVIIDAPPLLQVGDALTLTSHVDALIVVARMNVVRRGMVTELRRVLDSAPAPRLGFVITGAKGDTGYGYGYGYGYGAYAPPQSREKERERA